MPIHVTIAVNDREVEHLHIARMKGYGRSPDAVYTYSALQQADAPTDEREWQDGVFFTHRYGDDITVIVAEAISALQDKPAVEEVREDITLQVQQMMLSPLKTSGPLVAPHPVANMERTHAVRKNEDHLFPYALHER